MPTMSWLPGALKDLLRHVPTLLMDVVDWKAMGEVLPKLTQRLLTGAGSDDVRQKLTTIIPKELHFISKVDKKDLNELQKVELGELILELYFCQVLSGQPMFLDLRLSHFGIDENNYLWSPGHLWGEFNPDFVVGIRELYDGYFNNTEEVFARGLLQTGLVQPDWSDEDKKEMSDLLRATFDGGKASTPLHFSLASFQQSFQKVFDFIIEKKGTLGSDFVLLGIMLVTMYMSLEELGQPHLIAAQYEKAKNQPRGM